MGAGLAANDDLRVAQNFRQIVQYLNRGRRGVKTYRVANSVVTELSVTAVTQPANGFVVIQGNQVNFRSKNRLENLNEGEAATETFSHTVSDGADTRLRDGDARLCRARCQPACRCS